MVEGRGQGNRGLHALDFGHLLLLGAGDITGQLCGDWDVCRLHKLEHVHYTNQRVVSGVLPLAVRGFKSGVDQADPFDRPIWRWWR